MSASDRTRLAHAKRWVVKIGSALLTNDGQGLDRARMQQWVDEMVHLRSQGIELCVVSSGAIAVGLKTLALQSRPTEVPILQAAAAIGQMGLIQAWQSCFDQHSVSTAQVLLTHDDLADRARYLNARDTLKTLLRFGVVPVVNENDTVATAEIRFGDNDSLAALATNLIEADVLIILTDQDGFFDRDPRMDTNAQLIREARALDPSLQSMAGRTGGTLGSGGMFTKIQAAVQAARSGAMTVIASGRTPHVLSRLATGDGEIGSLLIPDLKPQAARKRWLASHKQVKGRLTVDPGAVDALVRLGRSLLPVGVTAVDGHFQRGDIVHVLNPDGEPIAVGLVNYDADVALRIRGLSTQQLRELNVLVEGDALIHRDNMALV